MSQLNMSASLLRSLQRSAVGGTPHATDFQKWIRGKNVKRFVPSEWRRLGGHKMWCLAVRVASYYRRINKRWYACAAASGIITGVLSHTVKFRLGRMETNHAVGGLSFPCGKPTWPSAPPVRQRSVTCRVICGPVCCLGRCNVTRSRESKILEPLTPNTLDPVSFAPLHDKRVAEWQRGHMDKADDAYAVINRERRRKHEINEKRRTQELDEANARQIEAARKKLREEMFIRGPHRTPKPRDIVRYEDMRERQLDGYWTPDKLCQWKRGLAFVSGWVVDPVRQVQDDWGQVFMNPQWILVESCAGIELDCYSTVDGRLPLFALQAGQPETIQRPPSPPRKVYRPIQNPRYPAREEVSSPPVQQSYTTLWGSVRSFFTFTDSDLALAAGEVAVDSLDL